MLLLKFVCTNQNILYKYLSVFFIFLVPLLKSLQPVIIRNAFHYCYRVTVSRSVFKLFFIVILK